MSSRKRYDYNLPHRESTRFEGWDYAGPGRYFVTICTADRESLFGEVVADEMVLSPAGIVVAENWRQIPRINPTATLDAFVVMPNHLHGIITIRLDRWEHLTETRKGPPHGAVPGSLGAILGAILGGFKAAAMKRIRTIPGYEGAIVWHRNYNDRVIRDADQLARARAYIHANPVIWPYDSQHPQNRRSKPR